ncbi:hypothetical protein E5206_09575 [Arthrobacter sp. PAMC25564]|uniref:hypothetical protein n=1 Tax=Arthrobacter sp. PAMC25564 TaxID=2565366 RepID=UPI0010A231A2|nr:hypothetical protein [Arthrobacter sp. PAMC25564]QCB97152.1 hypothetical protein E5206_09575 [Arthrobacter sp. PAMC25564]
MPKISLAVMENKVRNHYDAANKPRPDRRLVRIFAKEAARRFETFTHTPDEMEQLLAYCLHYWDETGEIAIENVQQRRNEAAAARRVAVAA